MIETLIDERLHEIGPRIVDAFLLDRQPLQQGFLHEVFGVVGVAEQIIGNWEKKRMVIRYCKWDRIHELICFGVMILGEIRRHNGKVGQDTGEKPEYPVRAHEFTSGASPLGAGGRVSHLCT